MNDILKQRLVGALILLALGVVFWPIVFVQPEQKTNATPRSIPEAPVVSSAPLEAPAQGELRGSPPLASAEEQQAESTAVDAIVYDEEGVAAAAVAESQAGADEQPAAAEVRSVAPDKLAVDGDGVPVAWTLQVATVSSAANAEALRKRLLEKNEKAYITTVSSGGKQLYRVCVGPKFERQELERIQASINAEFGVKTLLVRYLP
ncbi:MAG: SPOR domain-containing protein [Halioglobus sp.]|nr:SPOR domain-containing protein [Halioglobus sp.]